jgi:phosphoglycolate phosphatase
MTHPLQGSRIKAVIFDLDGTIADSFDVFVETLQEMMRRPKPLSPAKIADLRDSSLIGVITKLGIKKWQVPAMIIQGRREMAIKIDRINAFDGMPDVIHQLSAVGLDQYILSTNAEAAITLFLSRYDISQYFSSIYSGIGLTGKTKYLKRLMKQHVLTMDECLYVGDETRDIEAAQKAGIACIAVAWGFSSPAALQAHNPLALVKTPQELTQTILSLVKS